MPDEAEMEILVNDLTGGFGKDIMISRGVMLNGCLPVAINSGSAGNNRSDFHADPETDAEKA